MTNSQAGSHVSWVVRCSPRASGFSQSNHQNPSLSLHHTTPQSKSVQNPTTTQTLCIKGFHFTISIPTTILSIIRIDTINTDFVPCRAGADPVFYTNRYTQLVSHSHIFRLDLCTQLCVHSYTILLIHLHVIYSKPYGQPFKQDPVPPVRTHPSTYFQTMLAFFISRLEMLHTITAANLSVQLYKTNLPVLHHVTLLDQSKPHNHSSV